MTNFKHEIWKKSTPRGEGWERPHRKQKTMCPADHRHEDQPSEPPAAPPPADGNDGLANFALGEVQRQAAERGEEVTEVDVSFVQRALAESQRMRREKQSSDAKRAALWEGIEQRQGMSAVDGLQSAMSEHRTEVNAYMAAQQQEQQQEPQPELEEAQGSS